MKSLRWLVPVLCGSLSLAAGCSLLPGGKTRPRLVAHHRDGIKLDGDLSDWHGITFVTVTPQTGVFDPVCPPAKDAADLSFRFAVCHDDHALYVAVEVTDDVVRTDSCKPGATDSPAWDDDAIEVFIDGNHNRAPNARVKNGSELAYGGEFSLVANGAAMSRFSGFPDTFGKPDHWQGAVQQAGGRVRYEFRLTWKVMGGKVRPGDTIGFTLSAQDDDDDDRGKRRDHALYWVGNPPACFLDERAFADLYLQPK